jgi:hypothetical protein
MGEIASHFACVPVARTSRKGSLIFTLSLTLPGQPAAIMLGAGTGSLIGGLVYLIDSWFSRLLR